jgi:hypothetical protein
LEQALLRHRCQGHDLGYTPRNNFWSECNRRVCPGHILALIFYRLPVAGLPLNVHGVNSLHAIGLSQELAGMFYSLFFVCIKFYSGFYPLQEKDIYKTLIILITHRRWIAWRIVK